MKTKLLLTFLLTLSFFLMSFSIIAKETTDATDHTTKNCADEIPFGTGISDFTLVDADTNTDLFLLEEGKVINSSTFGNRNLNIRANHVETEISVEFALTGPIYRTWTEYYLPFALFSDSNGDYLGVKFPVGDYHLKASSIIVGTHLNTIEINFSVGPDTNAVIDFNLINALNNNDLDYTNKEYDIKNGQVFNIDNYPFVNGSNPSEVSIKANTNSYETGSVLLEISGPINFSRTENVEPFTLFGDSGGDFYGQIFPIGNYTLTATPYTSANLQGDKGVPVTIQFIVKEIAGISLQENVYVINADDNTTIAYLNLYQTTTIKKNETPTDHINLALFPRYGSNPIGSVFILLEGPLSHVRTENVEPFALFGDVSGNYYGNSLPIGSYKLTATPFTGPNGTGETGLANIYDFEIVNGSNGSALKSVLYPNPANNSVFIKTVDTQAYYDGAILDLSGNIVKKLPKHWKSDQSIDVSNLKQGIYFVQLRLGKELITQKLVVQ